MRDAVYNSGIREFDSNPLNRVLPFASLPFLFCVFLLIWLWPAQCLGADWSVPEQELAKKIAAVTGPGAVAVTFENRSSLGRRDYEIIRNGLHSSLESAGVHFVKAEQSAAAVAITFSENETSYVWVGQIHQAAGESVVVMVATARPEGAISAREAVPLSLRKTLLWTQSTPILDVAVLEEGAGPTHIAVLDGDAVALYKMQGGKWQQEQYLPISHIRPWPRDLRGRLVPAKDHLLEAYLPGVFCRTTSAGSIGLSCRDSDDPWPLVAGTLNGGDLSSFPSATLANGATAVVPQLRAFFAPSRNFFTGALTPPLGKFSVVPKFYSAALLPRDKYTLWLFAATDGQVHLVDGVSDQAARLGWGSSLATVRTACGAGWQILATAPGQTGDAVRAFEFPDRDPVAVSIAMEFPGPITALWAETRGDTAIAVTKSGETGNYEAFRVAVACNQ